jgi:hypothetical protein
MFSSRRKLIKFIKLLLATVICSFFISSLIALIHITLTVNINVAILGLTSLISSIVTYFYNEKVKANKDKLEPIKHVEVIENHQITVETEVHRKVNNNGGNPKNVEKDFVVRDSIETTVETTNRRTVNTNGGNYNEKIGRDSIGRDLITNNIKKITVGNREVGINPNNIVETFDEFRDILAQSIAQSSNALEAISKFTKELTEELRHRPEVKVCFDVDGNIDEQELVKKIFVDLLTQTSDPISEIDKSNLIIKPDQIQKVNISNSSEFIERFEYCGNDEYDAVYKRYTVHLFQEQSKGWLYKIRRSNSSILERSNKNRSRNIYFALGRAINEIDKELKINWVNNPE